MNEKNTYINNGTIGSEKSGLIQFISVDKVKETFEHILFHTCIFFTLALSIHLEML